MNTFLSPAFMEVILKSIMQDTKKREEIISEHRKILGEMAYVEKITIEHAALSLFVHACAEMLESDDKINYAAAAGTVIAYGLMKADALAKAEPRERCTTAQLAAAAYTIRQERGAEVTGIQFEDGSGSRFVVQIDGGAWEYVDLTGKI